jgi:hypothetical protein
MPREGREEKKNGYATQRVGHALNVISSATLEKGDPSREWGLWRKRTKREKKEIIIPKEGIASSSVILPNTTPFLQAREACRHLGAELKQASHER